MNDCFRDGVTKCTGYEWKLEKIDTYTLDYITDLWLTCDTTTSYTRPFGPALVQVFEFDLDLPKSDPDHKKVIYNLPYNINVGSSKKGEDESEDEDEEREEEDES